MQNPTPENDLQPTQSPAVSAAPVTVNNGQATVSAPAYDLGYFVASHFKSLPEDLQRELKILTTEQFKLLSSSMSRFNFLALPTEIRLEIYKALFTTRKARIKQAANAQDLLPGLKILWTNKLIHSEALPVLADLNTLCLMFVHEQVSKKQPVWEHRLNPELWNFHKFIIYITVCDLRLDPETKDVRTPNGVLSSLVAWITDAGADDILPANINIQVRFVTEYARFDRYSLENFATDFSRAKLPSMKYPHRDFKKPHCVGFLRMQLRYMLIKHQGAIAKFPKVKFTTNIDEEVDNGITWKRLSDGQAAFKDDTNQEAGVFITEGDWRGGGDAPDWLGVSYTPHATLTDIENHW